MKIAVACAALALVSWLVLALSPSHEEALVFAVVWTAMAVAYAPRAWRSRTSD